MSLRVDAPLCGDCPARHQCLTGGRACAQLGAANPRVSVGPLAPGSALYRAGDVATRVFHVRSGYLKTVRVDDDGEETITGFQLPGAVLGRGVHTGRYMEDAIALEITTVCAFDLQGLEHLMAQGHGRALLEYWDRQTWRQIVEAQTLRRRGAQDRLLGFLASYAEQLHALGRNPQHLPTPMSRRDIANFLGLSNEALSRATTALQRERRINNHRDHIEWLQPIHQPQAETNTRTRQGPHLVDRQLRRPKG